LRMSAIVSLKTKTTYSDTDEKPVFFIIFDIFSYKAFGIVIVV